MREDDWSRDTSGSYFDGAKPAQPVDNSSCPEFDRPGRMQQIIEQVRAQAQVQVATALRSATLSYLELAKKADPDHALEYYTLFALVASDRTSPEYQQAVAAIHARDADLKPDEALR